MKRCLQCHRFGIDWEALGHEVCPWKDCRWVNKEDIDLSKVEHPIKFKKFADALQGD